MMKRKLTMILAAALAALLAGCAGVPTASRADIAAASGRGSRWDSWSSDEDEKYTKADYELALSFRKAGYEKQSVAEFDKAVLDWENEEEFHKREESLQRLFYTLPQDDPNHDFISRTLFNTWKECEKKHYNACGQNKAPWYRGWAKQETTGDIFGDQVVLAGAYADFQFNYEFPDESRVTVEERDSILQGVETAVEQFLSRQDQKALEQEESMEKTLEAELKRLLKALIGKLAWAGDCSVDYTWDQTFSGPETAVTLTEEGGAIDSAALWNPGTYTREQYDLAVSSLKFEGYETMSIAEFNRRIHAALEGDGTGDTEGLEKRMMAYDMVLSSLPESDPNYRFFQETVPYSQEEYDAKAREVFTGKTVDPAVSGSCTAEVQEDVYGDQVTVGGADASYSFTYRILDETGLTVGERDEFLQAVKQGAQESLEKAAKERGGMSKAEFQAGVEAAGKAAETGKISFTGSQVEFCEVYR